MKEKHQLLKDQQLKAEKINIDSRFAKLSEELGLEMNKATKEINLYEEVVREIASLRRELKKKR